MVLLVMFHTHPAASNWDITEVLLLQDLRFSEQCCWWCKSSEMLCCVVGQAVTNVLKELQFFKMFGVTHLTTQCHIPEDLHPQHPYLLT